MKPLWPAILLLALAGACGTPQERCIARNTEDLRTVEKLIAESEGNLERGYALEWVTVWDTVWDWCYAGPRVYRVDGEKRYGRGRRYMCDRDIARRVQQPKAIDLKAEAETLDQLRRKRRSLALAAQPAIAQCQALYPESPATDTADADG